MLRDAREDAGIFLWIQNTRDLTVPHFSLFPWRQDPDKAIFRHPLLLFSCKWQRRKEGKYRCLTHQPGYSVVALCPEGHTELSGSLGKAQDSKQMKGRAIQQVDGSRTSVQPALCPSAFWGSMKWTWNGQLYWSSEIFSCLRLDFRGSSIQFQGTNF